MLDRLLGRTKLKDRIEALEAELERAEAQLDGERRRRREAVRDRQAADERVNRLEDRVADLEGQLERARAGDRVVEGRGREDLRGDRLAEVLSRLRSVRTGPEAALTAMVAGSGSLPAAVMDAFGDHAALVSRAAPCLALTDDAGIVSAALVPALPPAPFATWDDGFRLEDRWFRPTGEFGFAVVRSDIFAYGAYDGPTRVETEGFESELRADHSKGGFSQARFERRRDDQIDAHVERCREALSGRAHDRLIVVGERTVLGEFADLADHTAPVDATGAPEAALDDAFRSFFTATLYRI